MREGIRDQHAAAEGHRVQGAAADCRTLATQPPADERLLQAVHAFPDGVAAADRTRLEAAGLEAVRTRVQPAFATLRTFLETRVPARLLRPGRLVADERRPGRLRLFRAAVHDDDADAAADPRARPEGGGAHPRRDGSASRHRCGLHRHAAGVLHVPADRSAVLLQDRPRACSRAIARWPSASTPSW